MDGGYSFSISRNGVLKHFRDFKDRFYDGKLVIPEGVKAIGDRAFEGCDMSSVIIPEGVEQIEKEAFNGCLNLTELSFPNSLTSIGSNAFANCSRLTSVVIPNSHTSIDFGAFYNCRKLNHLVFSSEPENIGNGAFSGCAGLADPDGFVVVGGILFDYTGKGTDITIPGNVTVIRPAFSEIRSQLITGIIVPEGVTAIDDYAFSNFTGLKNIKLPDTLKTIGRYAFSSCRMLTEITVPESVISIGDYAFEKCRFLERVVIPNSDIKFGRSVFCECPKIPVTNGFVIINGIVFDYRGPGGIISIPDDIHSVKSLSSAGSEITGINVSDINILPPKYRETAVLSFASDGGSKEDPRYDSHCRYITQSARKLLSTAMKNRTLLSLMIREKLIPDKVVDDYIEAAQKTKDAGLISLMLEYKNENVTPEEREKLEKKKDKEQDTVIERQFARTGKEGIGGLNIAVTRDLETFKNRNEFKQCITEKGAKLATGISSRTDYLIMNDPNSGGEKSRKAKELGIEIISERKFNVIMGREFIIKDNDIVSYAGPGGKVVVPEGIKYIRARAFCDCETVTEIVLPDGLKRIGNRSFAGCQNLLNINLPDGVTSIGEEAFFHCDSLTDLFIPRSVKKISGYFVFSACPKLTLHVEEGSFAESYAKEQQMKFVTI